MPKQKDLKRVVRSRMKKTGESYTAARAQLIRKREPAIDYAAKAGLADPTEKTDRGWAEWVKILDSAGAAKWKHGEIAKHAASLGAPPWWSQAVAVGYERIRGLREVGQRSSGVYAASKSKTFSASLSRLYGAFASAPRRKRWLDAKVTVRTATRNKVVRFEMADGSRALISFAAKGPSKTTVAIDHEKLPDRAAIVKAKSFWIERLEALAADLS